MYSYLCVHDCIIPCTSSQVALVLSVLEGSDGYSYANKMTYRLGHDADLAANEQLSERELALFGLDEHPLVIEARSAQRHRTHEPPVEMLEIADLHTPRPI